MLIPYGQLIDVFGKKMCVKVDGSGKKVVVLLHGGGIVSPILELDPLAVLLKNNFTVVTIEYFGYGFSDKTDKPRTIENITDEIHEALHILGFPKYYLMAHSISGIYSLYYINKYPNEVEGFAGIDISVPRQNEFFNTEKINVISAYVLRFLNNVGIMRLIYKFSPKLFIKDICGYKYSREDLETLRKLYFRNISNKTVINELKNSTENFQKALNMKFPKSVPVLLFLADDTCKQIKQWYDLHIEVIENTETSKVITLSGSHFLYRQYSSEIVETFKNFIMNN
ncbi:MAG: alpha/beta hydrolase [Oscillospiraceae bacterium]|nr:alpha/beta hydrolase [Oscillospiraceae bacterium]